MDLLAKYSENTDISGLACNHYRLPLMMYNQLYKSISINIYYMIRLVCIVYYIADLLDEVIHCLESRWCCVVLSYFNYYYQTDYIFECNLLFFSRKCNLNIIQSSVKFISIVSVFIYNLLHEFIHIKNFRPSQNLVST